VPLLTRPLLEGDVLPLQREQFPLAHRRVDRGDDQVTQVRDAARGEQSGFLLRRGSSPTRFFLRHLDHRPTVLQERALGVVVVPLDGPVEQPAQRLQRAVDADLAFAAVR
jgi:hypothetical protein